MSPGRAASKAAAMAARRSAMSSRSWPRRRPAASAPRAISSRMASRSSPRGSSSVTTTSRARSPAIRPICGRFAVSRSPADPKTAISPRRGPPPPGRAGRARSRATPGCGRSRRRPRTAGRHRPAPSGPGRRRGRPGRAGPRPDRGRAPRPSATTASALWTLNRPARRSSRDRRRPARRDDRDAQAVGVLLDARRADVGGRLRAVGEDPGAGIAGASR